jgi:hypothetical protein
MRGRLASLVLLSVLLVALFPSIYFVGQRGYAVQADSESSQWISWASNAWKFFQPGAAVDTNTGLCGASLIWNWPYFTEWDLGTYILAVLDAEEIGILPSAGSWGSTARLNKIMTFLQNRELAPGNISYVWHDARTGAPAWNLSNATTGVSDLGYLLIALHAVKTQRPEYTSVIDGVVYGRMNLTQLASDPIAWTNTAGVYEWYVAHGFKYFGFDQYAPVQDALDSLDAIITGPQVTTYNVTLPITEFTSEPLLLAAFTLPPEPDMTSLIYKAYLAQENRYHATGNFTAFSEGNTGLGSPSYVYEWIVQPDGQTWKIGPQAITPIAYIKVGFGFYALFRTQYALDLINHVNATFTDFTYGYWDGVDEAGRVVNSLIDRTNGMVLASARYVLKDTLGSLGGYPMPFVSGTGLLNATFVIGDTEPHPPVGWRAYTADWMGSLGVAGTLGQLSSSGNLLAKMDTSIAVWNDTQGLVVGEKVVVDWNKLGNSNVVSIGGPLVNLLTYHYEELGSTPFSLTWAGNIPRIHSDLSGHTYSFNLGVDDYAVLSIYSDNGRIVLVGWGLTHRGTIAVCQVLQYFNSQYAGLLSGHAMIIKWADGNGDAEVDLGDEISVVESWS